MALKGNFVTFRRQTREHDREVETGTEHYIIENNDARSFMGYVTVRKLETPNEMAATVLLQQSDDWTSPEGNDILRAIEQYAFGSADCSAVALEVGRDDADMLQRLTDKGFTQREERGSKVVVVKERDVASAG